MKNLYDMSGSSWQDGPSRKFSKEANKGSGTTQEKGFAKATSKEGGKKESEKIHVLAW